MKAAVAACAAESQRRMPPNASARSEAASAVMLPCVVMQSIVRRSGVAFRALRAISGSSHAVRTRGWTLPETKRAKSGDGDEDMSAFAAQATRDLEKLLLLQGLKSTLNYYYSEDLRVL